MLSDLPTVAQLNTMKSLISETARDTAAGLSPNDVAEGELI